VTDKPDFMMEMFNRTKNRNTASREIEGIYHFARAKDEYGKLHYFVAESEEAIEKRCEGGLISSELAIEYWATYVDPIMVAHHFEWVGKGHNPFRISKPFDYKNPNKKPIEKW
tara:strand:+ start:2207 stop:2545 length:339 start_codon:yes stop_codon:yes gene_type:complete